MQLLVVTLVILKKLIQAYREIGSEAGHASHELKVGAHSWGWIAEDSEQAVKIIPSDQASGGCYFQRPSPLAGIAL